MTGTEAPRTAGDILRWLKRSGINRPLPCKVRSKATDYCVTSEGIYGKPGISSYLQQTPERDAVIDRFWEPRQTWTRDLVSMSISADFVWNGGYHCGCIDVDTDDLLEPFWNNEILEPLPVISGKKGCKLLFRFKDLNGLPGLLQWKQPGQKKASIELFGESKHFLIYGEHPDSTRQNPIFYQVVRHFGKIIPVLEYADVIAVIDGIAEKHSIPRTGAITAPVNEPQRPRTTSVHINTIADRYGLRIEDIGYPLNAKIQGDEIVGVCPLVPTAHHDQNYRINPSKNTWQCWNGNTGGDALEYFAILEGLVSIDEFTRGSRPLDGRMGEVFAALKRAGYRDSTTREINTSGWCKS
jgi:hypothetical protein